MDTEIMMVSPDTFDVTYTINPWMHPGREPIDHSAAVAEWQRLRDAYQQLGVHVTVMQSDAAVPDLVFATDGSLNIGRKTALANFRYAQRVGEVPHHRAWVEERGQELFTPQAHFEGGDALRWRDALFMGYGFRSEPAAQAELAKFFGIEVYAFELVNPEFYHLDTALSILGPNLLAYYPPAFSAKAQDTLRSLPVTLVEATLPEAEAFALNSFTIGDTVLMAPHAPRLSQACRDHGLTVREIDTSEFLKAGGGIKCLTNALYS